MLDFLFLLFRKLTEIVLVLTTVAGLYNFLTVPGSVTERLVGSYERTSEQGRKVFQAGQSVICSQGEGVARLIGKGILETKKRQEGYVDQVSH